MILYYFSATGNTLTTAKYMKEMLEENCSIVSVSALKDVPVIDPEDNVIGFLFPIYHADMPWLFRDTIKRIRFPEDSYIFSIATFRGSPGACTLRMKALLESRGQKLSYACKIRMPGNSVMNPPEVDAELLRDQKDNIRKIIPDIENRVVQEIEGETPEPSILEAGPANLRGIKADETCIGCGTCVRVCPMNNIELKDGHAEIGNQCLTCLACFHWCPVEAIFMETPKASSRRPKYHHPDVKLPDIIKAKTL